MIRLASIGMLCLFALVSCGKEPLYASVNPTHLTDILHVSKDGEEGWPTLVRAHAESGVASYYGYNIGAPACGMKQGPMTAAHKTLPCGSRVKVTNTRNGKSITVTIVDRGPFVRGRVIDLSPEGARAIGMDGLAPVRLEKQ